MYNKIESFVKELNTGLIDAERIILAIDGECASLKSTVAEALCKKFRGSVIHCDDFYLPSELRTPQRLEEPGGNIDYVRMKEEVIDRLYEHKSIQYRPFDCHSMKLKETITLPETKLIVVEGAYSMHPFFGKYYDSSLFLYAKEEERLNRIRKRGQNVEAFAGRWMPLEYRYFNEYQIKNSADYVIDTTDFSGIAELIKHLEVLK